MAALGTRQPESEDPTGVSEAPKWRFPGVCVGLPRCAPNSTGIDPSSAAMIDVVTAALNLF